MNFLQSLRSTAIALVLATQVFSPASASETVGKLPRKVQHARDSLPGVRFDYGVFATSDGARLRTIFSRPQAVNGRVPAIYFVQWLSCSTIELVEPDGWTQLLSHLIKDSGYAVMRTEKSGVGDSEGPACDELDYVTEVRHHREALEAFLKREDIDPGRVFLFGASMGANEAPLIASKLPLAGIVAWGGGAKTWFERMLGFDRRALELGGTPVTEISERMRKNAWFHAEYLLHGKTPAQIEASSPQLRGVWQGMVGTDAKNHYGRPFRYHQQAQLQDWPGAWSQITAPVLVMYGEYDWFEDADSHRLIADIVNSAHPGNARFRVVPGTNHHFSRFVSARQAFAETGGTKNGDEVAAIIIDWTKDVLAQGKAD